MQFLRHLGLNLPDEPSIDNVEEEVEKINALLANRPISTLIDSPWVTNEKACFSNSFSFFK